MTVNLDPKLVFRNMEFKNKEEVLAYLATKLYEAGYVKEEYIIGIQQRENEYPTGLPSSLPRLAIPHANHDLVNQTTLAICTLAEPVLFHNMESTQEELPVRIVIMMAIAEPHGQIEMLQKIVTIIQDEAYRKAMIEADSDETLATMLQEVVA